MGISGELESVSKSDGKSGRTRTEHKNRTTMDSRARDTEKQKPAKNWTIDIKMGESEGRGGSSGESVSTNDGRSRWNKNEETGGDHIFDM